MNSLRILFRKLIRKLNQLNTTNICICGHSIDEHHGGSVRYDDGALHIIYGQVYTECETGYFEGMPTNDNPCQCSLYWDKGWLFMPKKIREIKKMENNK